MAEDGRPITDDEYDPEAAPMLGEQSKPKSKSGFMSMMPKSSGYLAANITFSVLHCSFAVFLIVALNVWAAKPCNKAGLKTWMLVQAISVILLDLPVVVVTSMIDFYTIIIEKVQSFKI